MKRTGEKMYSYVHYEKEFAPEFRTTLKSMKDTNDIANVFIETIFKLFKKIKPEIPEFMVEEIVFLPEGEKRKWILEEKLSMKLTEELEHSDLESIVDRFSLEAYKWYEHVMKSDESRVFFKEKPGDIIHGR